MSEKTLEIRRRPMLLFVPQLMTASFALVLQRGPISPAVMRTAASPSMKIPQILAQPAMAAFLAATIAFAPIDAVHAAAKKSGGGGGGRPNVVQTKSGIKTSRQPQPRRQPLHHR